MTLVTFTVSFLSEAKTAPTSPVMAPCYGSLITASQFGPACLAKLMAAFGAVILRTSLSLVGNE